ncbi:HD domain-containing protein [Candidatus Laterigemmans baculatus]|uniref:HD domain-containing protein n=1 Tax=Candidatus Laterigemmans baculatus TaxID=2770505 RepID=UPI001F1F84EA|nr:metal-dependent phosphohydrolase [Candidatus Laterigemmans baculatus]
MTEEVSVDSAAASLIRIPPEMDVPVTPRVMRIIDSEPMRRLGRVSQLGLVSLVYPGGVHSRLEHSLGVYRGALGLLEHFASDGRFRELVSPAAADAFIVASLVHDCGHWPFCHPIEDMQLPGVPTHEARARALIGGGELAPLIAAEWRCEIESVLRILEKRPADDAERLLSSLLSGPIDIDKMDYLIRDSLHAGVPYGRNFDVGRLLASIRLHPDEPRMAIGDKGRTAAEMMVFARYVMFSEVYWHHAVRSATAMLQRAVFLLRESLELASSTEQTPALKEEGRLDPGGMYDLDDAHWIARIREVAAGSPAESLVEGLFGPRRRLLKRVAQFNVLDEPARHQQLAHRPYWWLVAASGELAERLSKRLAGRLSGPLTAADVIIDAPPVKLEVDINVDVIDPLGRPRPLGQVSPVVEALANRQFDSHVKRVRVFVPEGVRDALPGGRLPPEDLDAAIEATRSIA